MSYVSEHALIYADKYIWYLSFTLLVTFTKFLIKSVTAIFICSIGFSFLFGQATLGLSQTILVPLPQGTSGSTTQILIDNNTLQKQNVSYIEDSIRITSISNGDSHAGIIWTSANNTDYYAFLRPISSTVSFYSSHSGEFDRKVTPPLIIGAPYILKVVFTNNATNILLNNIQVLHFSQPSANTNISKIGLRSYNSIVQFEPPKLK
jgi:hypothetical protein